MDHRARRSHRSRIAVVVLATLGALKIEQPQVSADYRANFATLWARAKCVNPESGSCLY